MNKRRTVAFATSFAMVLASMVFVNSAGFANSDEKILNSQNQAQVELDPLFDVGDGDNLLLLGMPTAEEETQEDEDVTISEYCFVITDSLTCRALPDSESESICEFEKNTELAVVSKTDDGSWYEVYDGKNTGWCDSLFLSSTPDTGIKSDYSVAPSFSYTDEDLYWLACAIQFEAGCSWISDSQQLMVGNVVINRMFDSHFANTIYGVLSSPGQYAWEMSTGYHPSARAYANAKRLLDGERFLPSNVVYQAEFTQGHGTYLSIYDSGLGTTTYFCYL